MFTPNQPLTLSRSFSHSLSIAGFITTAVVKVDMADLVPPKPKSSAAGSSVVQEEVNGGEVAGVIIGLVAFFALLFAATHYRHKVRRQCRLVFSSLTRNSHHLNSQLQLCPQLVKAWQSSASKGKLDPTPPPSGNAANFGPPQGRRDSIPLSAAASSQGDAQLRRPTTAASLDVAAPSDNLSITQVYVSSNPMFQESEKEQNAAL